MYTLTADATFEIIDWLDFMSVVKFSATCRDIRLLVINNLKNIGGKRGIADCKILDDLRGPITRRNLVELDKNVTNEVVRNILLDAGVKPDACTFATLIGNDLHPELLWSRITHNECLLVAAQIDDMRILNRSLNHATNGNECFTIACKYNANKVLKKLATFNQKELCRGIHQCILSNNKRGIEILLRNDAVITKDHIRSSVLANKIDILEIFLENEPKMCNFASQVSAVIGNSKALKISIEYGATNHSYTRRIGMELEHQDIVKIYC